MGAGIYSNETELEISGSFIQNNIASADLNGGSGIGGGVFSSGPASSSNLIIINSVIEGNQADSGAGIVSGSFGNFSVINSTITRNTANTQGGGIQADNIYSDSKVINSILYFNSPNEIWGNPIISYSNIQGGYEGEGNINADPLFAGNNDYHLRLESPCIDSGTNIGAPNTDIEGTKRPLGKGYDMGAYEYISGIKPVMSWILLLLGE